MILAVFKSHCHLRHVRFISHILQSKRGSTIKAFLNVKQKEIKSSFENIAESIMTVFEDHKYQKTYNCNFPL